MENWDIFLVEWIGERGWEMGETKKKKNIRGEGRKEGRRGNPIGTGILCKKKLSSSKALPGSGGKMSKLPSPQLIEARGLGHFEPSRPTDSYRYIEDLFKQTKNYSNSALWGGYS